MRPVDSLHTRIHILRRIGPDTNCKKTVTNPQYESIRINSDILSLRQSTKINMSDDNSCMDVKNNNMKVDEVMETTVLDNTHKNAFFNNTNPAPIIKLTGNNIAGDYVFLPNDELPQQWLKKYKSKDTCVPVIPTEVIDPSHFWAQLQINHFEIEDMMIAMLGFYNGHSRMFAALPQNVCVKLIVAVLRNGWYFRSRIVGLTPTHVHVFFVDYGRTTYAPYDKIFHLHKEFGVLKTQAIRCKLYNLKAATGHMLYPKLARIATSRMIKYKPMIAFIDEIHKDTWTLELSLHQLEPNTITVNDWLVRHGHAKLIIQ